MQLASIKPGDILLYDVRGDRFYALALGASGGTVQIESLTRRPIPALHVKSRQVVAHWRKSKQSRA